MKVCCLRYSPYDRWRSGYVYHPPRRERVRGPRENLSARQRRTLRWLAEFREREGRWPWLREAAQALGFSPRGVEVHLRGLENRGLVRVVNGPARGRRVELVTPEGVR